MSIITCTGCGQKFDGDKYGDSPDFDMHTCPSLDTDTLEEEEDEHISPDTYAIVMIKVHNPKPTEELLRRPENATYEGIKSDLVEKLSKVLGTHGYSASDNAWWIDDIHNDHLSGS